MPSEKIAPPLWQRNLLFAVVCLAGVGAVVSNLLKSDTMAAPKHQASRYEKPVFRTPVNWVDEEFAAACGALGLAELGDKYADRASRDVGDDDITETLALALTDLPVVDAVDSLREVGVKCAQVRHMMDAHEDPQAQVDGLTVATETIVGPIKQMGPPFHFSVTPVAAQRPGPGLGEHTDEVLAELDYSDERVAELRAAGAVQ